MNPESPGDCFSLDGRTAMVTGAGGGLGKAVAAAFLDRGARVVACDVREDRLGAGAGNGPWLPLAFDVTCEEAVHDAVSRAVEQFGAIDVLVNGAGISTPEAAVDLPVAAWRAVLEVNLTGAFMMAQAVGRHMLAHGRGSIINVSSIYGCVAPTLHPSSAYTASKAGLLGLTRALAAEWGPKGIRVNAVCPTYFHSDLSRRRLVDPVMQQAVLDHSLLKVVAQPEDIVGGILFLASDAARLVTGHALSLDGGWLAI